MLDVKSQTQVNQPATTEITLILNYSYLARIRYYSEQLWLQSSIQGRSKSTTNNPLRLALGVQKAGLDSGGYKQTEAFSDCPPVWLVDWIILCVRSKPPYSAMRCQSKIIPAFLLPWFPILKLPNIILYTNRLFITWITQKILKMSRKIIIHSLHHSAPLFYGWEVFKLLNIIFNIPNAWLTDRKMVTYELCD